MDITEMLKKANAEADLKHKAEAAERQKKLDGLVGKTISRIEMSPSSSIIDEGGGFRVTGAKVHLDSGGVVESDPLFVRL